ncbi:MAG: hypothetical protein IPP72_11255 [Chitinophagaceae bacterium]|nr:hypothetical protein [Chitinophagaceae bacterium]
MKKILFVAILGLIAITSQAQVTSKTEKEVLSFDFNKVVIDKDNYEKQLTEMKNQIKNEVDQYSKALTAGCFTLEISACGQSGTFYFDTNVFSTAEILTIIVGIYNQYCGIGICQS